MVMWHITRGWGQHMTHSPHSLFVYLIHSYRVWSNDIQVWLYDRVLLNVVMWFTARCEFLWPSLQIIFTNKCYLIYNFTMQYYFFVNVCVVCNWMCLSGLNQLQMKFFFKDCKSSIVNTVDCTSIEIRNALWVVSGTLFPLFDFCTW